MTLNFSTVRHGVINQQPFPVSIFILTGGMKGGQKFSTLPLQLAGSTQSTAGGVFYAELLPGSFHKRRGG
jgi:hypothetical protein